LDKVPGQKPYGTEADMPQRMVSAPAGSSSGASRATPSSPPVTTPRAAIPPGRRGSGCGGGATLSLGATIADGLQAQSSWEENHKVAVGMQRKAVGECSLRATGDDSLLLDSPFATEPPLDSLSDPSAQPDEQSSSMQVQVVSVYSSTPASATPRAVIADTDRQLQRQTKAIEAPAAASAAGQRGTRRSSSAQPSNNRLGFSAGTIGAKAAALSGSSWAQATGRGGDSSSLAITAGGAATSPRSGTPISPRSRAGRKSGSSTALPASGSSTSNSAHALVVQPRGATRALSADADRGIGKSLLLGSGTRIRPSLQSTARPSMTSSAAPSPNSSTTIWTPRANGVQHRQAWQSGNSSTAPVKSTRQIARQWQASMGQNISAMRSELDSLKAREATVSRQMTGSATQAIADIR